MTTIHEGSPLLLFSLRVPARADRLKFIRSIVGDAAALYGCNDAYAQDLMLAVDEACQNIIRHAYQGEDKGDIVIEMFHDTDHIDVLLCDSAPVVDPATIHPRDLVTSVRGGPWHAHHQFGHGGGRLSTTPFRNRQSVAHEQTHLYPHALSVTDHGPLKRCLRRSVAADH